MEKRGLERRGRYLTVDCRHADPRLWSQRGRALSAACIVHKINRVLIDATDCDPEGHHALRDALTALILTGIPDGFRLALVTNVSALQAYFGTLQRDLEFLQIPAGCFAEEGEAMEWLHARAAPPPAALTRECQEA